MSRRLNTIVALLFLVTVPVFAKNLIQAQGFDPSKLYDYHDVDKVNTFNGNLSASIPIGPSYPVGGGTSYELAVNYNSKVWIYQLESTWTVANANPWSNAGLGWMVSLGVLLPPTNSWNTMNTWVYIAPDGATHDFYSALHNGDPATLLSTGVAQVFYTQDGSYLRLLKKTDGTMQVCFPNGSVHTFSSAGKLLSMTDAFNNVVTVTGVPQASILTTPCPATDSYAWRITDSTAGRTNYVCFTSAYPFPATEMPGQVERIILAAPQSSTGAARSSTYLFAYTQQTVNRGCWSSNTYTVSVPTLSSITLPDGSKWDVTTNVAASASCEQGALKTLSLPTGALISYEYGTYGIPTEQCTAAVGGPDGVTGVAKRTVTERPGATPQSWTYSTSLTYPSGTVLCETEATGAFFFAAPADELKVTVKDPNNNVTEHFYSVWPPGNYTDTSSRGTPMYEYGLPFTRVTTNPSSTNIPSGFPAPAGSLYLSTRTYTAAGYAAVPKQPLRSTYLRYVIDPQPPNCVQPQYCYVANPRISDRQTVFHDDGNKYLQNSAADFDGLGHFRNTLLTFPAGSFAGSTVTSYTGYNTVDTEVGMSSPIVTGTYTTAGTYTPPSTAKPWVINLYPRRTVTLNDATPVTALTQTCFQSSTGALLSERDRLNATSRDVRDIVRAYSYSTGGNLTAETFYGGDVKANAPAGALCAAVTPTTSTGYDYRIDHTYTTGIRATSKYAGASFFSLKRTIDGYTGAVMTDFDTADVPTTYGYDTAFRLTSTAPQGLAATTYTYTNAVKTTFAPAKVVVSATDATAGTKRSEYQYDGLGRLWRTKTLMPDSTTTVEELLYDGVSNLTSRSMPERLPATGEFSFVPAKKTLYQGFDPFGRPATIASPDSTSATMTYLGERQTSLTETVYTTSGLAGTTTTLTNDARGLLSSVSQGGTTSATYTYDVGGRLTGVSMSSGASTQTRTFTYDLRGLLRSETHPELGSAGNGTTQYYDPGTLAGFYDARGHALRAITGSVNGAFDVSTSFDAAERPTTVKLTTGQVLKSYIYDGANLTLYPQCASNRCLGRLVETQRYNATDLGTIAVSQSHTYDATSGRLTRRDTTVGNGTSFTGEAFSVAVTRNTFGDVRDLTYPCRRAADGSCVADPGGRVVTRGYTNGRLSSVSGGASSITYAPNGTLDTITHGTGTAAVRQTWVGDPSGLPRPCAIFVYGPGVTLGTGTTCGKGLSGTGPQWISGAYAYDGAGNISSIGANTYRYDARKRLVTWTEGGLGSTQSYDAWGNIVGGTLTVSGTTNHYSSYSYDAAGNVTGDGKGTYTFAATGTMTDATVATTKYRYLYDALDERVAVIERPGSANKTTWMLRGLDGELLRQYTDDYTSGSRVFSLKEDELWGAGLLLASATLTRTLHYGVDHLGSPRYVTDSNGAFFGSQAFSPFGFGGTSNGGALQFTGQERDKANIGGGLKDLPDYFHARYYRPDAGRFLSVDPVLDLDKATRDPQMWNRYAYVSNNPMSRVDPDGRSWMIFSRKKETITLYDSDGDEVGSWKASNNPQLSPATAAPLAEGRYPFQDKKKPHTHSTSSETTVRDENGKAVKGPDGKDQKVTLADDSAAGKYGTYGIFRLEPFKDNVPKEGTTHVGVGVHSGRVGMFDRARRTGWQATTQGCIRTTDEAIKAMKDIAPNDPLEYVEVTP